MKETLERAVELIGYGRELPDDEAIGIACGWWPCFASQLGRLRAAQPGRHGHDRHRSAGERHRRRDGDARASSAEELGMRPEDFSLLYQDTDAAPLDMGSCGSQTTFNSVRAVSTAAADVREQLLDVAAEKLEAAPDDLELVEGAVRVKGSPEKSVTIADLAGRGDIPRQGLRRAARGAAGGRRRVSRPARPRVVPRAAADHARGAREGRPRDGRRAGAAGRRGARLRHDPQPRSAPTVRSTAAS